MISDILFSAVEAIRHAGIEVPLSGRPSRAIPRLTNQRRSERAALHLL
jgi:hypothetical protein